MSYVNGDVGRPPGGISAEDMYFVPVFRGLLRDPRLNVSHALVFGWLHQFCSTARDGVFPSRRVIADRTGLSVPTIGRALKLLGELGYLTERRRRKRDGSYTTSLYQTSLAPLAAAANAPKEAARPTAATPENVADDTSRDQSKDQNDPRLYKDLSDQLSPANAGGASAPLAPSPSAKGGGPTAADYGQWFSALRAWWRERYGEDYRVTPQDRAAIKTALTADDGYRELDAARVVPAVAAALESRGLTVSLRSVLGAVNWARAPAAERQQAGGLDVEAYRRELESIARGDEAA